MQFVQSTFKEDAGNEYGFDDPCPPTAVRIRNLTTRSPTSKFAALGADAKIGDRTTGAACTVSTV